MNKKNSGKLSAMIVQKQLLKKAYCLPQKDSLLYHYTSLDVLWKCIEGNSMYARNVRFSNDKEEYGIGKEKISKFLGDNSMGECFDDAFFMICFCAKEDLLSQWRGYAQDGVCVGFDFSYGVIYNNGDTKKRAISKYHECTLLNNKEYADDEKKWLNSNNKKEYIDVMSECTVKGEAYTVFSVPNKVTYICNDVNGVDYKTKENDLKDKLEEIRNEINEQNLQRDLLFKYIPYIKNSGFEEEDEYRLLFDLHDIGNMSKRKKEEIWDKKITYIEKTQGIKLPNIVLRFGDANESWDMCQYVILEKHLFLPKYSDFYTKLRELLKENGIKVIKGEKENADIVVGMGNNQEELSIEIESLMDKLNLKRDGSDICIWYQGHLPIRRVMVAPGEDAERIKESIEFYKNRIFWLKYITVTCSKIPYRKKL